VVLSGLTTVINRSILRRALKGVKTMAERFDSLSEKLIEFIGKQHMFFVGTAAAEGTVNVSPKGMDSFRILSPTKAAWLNLTGSGNETAAHILENSRMTIMFCSFDKQPLILRVYGQATTVHPRDEQWAELSAFFPEYTGARQIFSLDIELVQTSCGYANTGQQLHLSPHPHRTFAPGSRQP
jgi:predicted pyridoxine 5'-phosphate oxidase superfamily flavin-nucleotide-binding protein